MTAYIQECSFKQIYTKISPGEINCYDALFGSLDLDAASFPLS